MRHLTVTSVFAFALPAGYESLNVGDDAPEEDGGTWEAPGLAAVISYVEYLPEAITWRIREHLLVLNCSSVCGR